MNNYKAGYNLVSIIKWIAWMSIALSALIGALIYENALGDFKYIGWIIFFAGVFMGIILLGFSSIAEAIMDAAQHQEKSVYILRSIQENTRKSSHDDEDVFPVKNSSASGPWDIKGS